MYHRNIFFAPDTETGGAEATATVDNATSTAEIPDAENIQGADVYADIKYRSQLSKEIADNRDVMDSIKEYKTVSELASGYSKLKSDSDKKMAEYEEKLSKSITIPSKGASNEEWQAYMKKVGIPEKSDDYKLTDISGINKDKADAIRQVFQKQAHKNGLSTRQANNMWATVLGVINTENASAAAGLKQLSETMPQRLDDYLKKTYEVDSDRKAATNEIMANVAEFAHDTGLGQALKETGWVYNPDLMYKISEHVKKNKAKAEFGTSANKSETEGLFKHSEEFDRRYKR